MKTKKRYIALIALLSIALVMIFQACEPEETYPRTRLFQPVLNEDLYSIDNTIIVNLGNMKDAESYKIEVSIDSFETVLYTVDVDTNFVILDEELLGEELLWFFIYQVQVTAYADDSEYNSLPSFLGSVRTQKFPSNMGTPTYFDILDTRARVFWSESGASITRIKVFDGSDIRLTTPLLDFPVTLLDNLAGEVFIEGLVGSSTYQVAIYSGETLRGWEQYVTRPPLVSGDNVVDLTGLTSPVVLSFILDTIADGSTVILEPGTTYQAFGFAFDKSISFLAGYSFIPELPIIDCSSNFNLVDGSNVDYVTFKNVHFMASDDGFNARYIFNTNVAANMGEVKFESCVMKGFRGIFRMKDNGPGVLDKFTMIDCQVDSIRDYGILTVDIENWQCNEILIQNSTISQARAFLQNRNNSTSVIIDGCTVHESPSTGREIFRWRTEGQDNVTNGITISNTIWGHAWDEGESGSYEIEGYNGLGSTNWNIVNTYTTSDFAYGLDQNEIPGFPSAPYSGTAAELWVDPANSIFDFLDMGFAGKGSSGDPRWRMGL